MSEVQGSLVEQHVTLSRTELDLLLDPWYHDFSPLGLRTPQKEGYYRENQRAKQQPLFGLVDDALALCRRRDVAPTVLELFCADGFYGLYALRRGGTRLVGMDRNPEDVAKAALAARLTGAGAAEFRVGDVLDELPAAEVVICAGGLYHLNDPDALLQRLHETTGTALVLQTAVHAGRDEADYFESPAPGWTWGSRYSHASFLSAVERAGWRLLRHHRGELPGNPRPEDAGSSYALAVPS